MNLQNLNGKLVAVLGYGQEGKATAAYLIKHGIKPVLFDQKSWENWDEIEKLEIRKLGLNFIFGPDCFKELAGFDVAFRSPGVRLSELTTYNLQLTSQTKWFFEHCPAKIIGVTGTKGKGTTASLIYEILSLSLRGVRTLSGDEAILFQDRLLRSDALPHNDNMRVYLTGNIGKIQPLEILDGLSADDYVVYELSSFQLQDMDSSPHIGVVLMVTSEHLDYHRDQREYIAAKSAITKFQTAGDFAVINADFENSVQIGKQGKGKKFYFSRQQELENGCFVKDNQIVLVGAGFKPAPTGAIIKISDLQLRGAHNLENVCAAVCVGRILNIGDKTITQAVAGFKGLEHRLEFVAEKKGIKFYNDSFSTTPETAIAAINSFTEPEIIILGGSSKNSDFSELGKAIVNATNIKAVILIGEEAGRIKQAIEPILASPLVKGRKTVPTFASRGVKILEGAKNMKEIFAQIKSVAQKGDVILLSPACASFGMFKNYVGRGSQFKEAVRDF